MTIIVYGIKSCDSCKKALKWLAAEGLVHKFHDFRSDGLDKALTKRLLKGLGGAAALNRSSTTWRSLSDADKTRAESAGAGLVDLVVQNPTLLKRPIFTLRDGALVQGFKPAQQKLVQGFKPAQQKLLQDGT